MRKVGEVNDIHRYCGSWISAVHAVGMATTEYLVKGDDKEDIKF